MQKIRLLSVIQYVLEHSTETDLVYNCDINFNVFRPDLHYMWYGKNDFHSSTKKRKNQVCSG